MRAERWRRALSAALLGLAAWGAGAAPAVADEPPDRGLLWRAQRDDRTVWLYGTLHVGRPGWATPGPRVRRALAASDTVALELDLLDAGVQRALAEALDAAPPLALPAPIAQRLAALARAEGLEPAALARLAPELQLAMLTLQAAGREGLGPADGADMALAAAARARGLRSVSLETPGEQVQALVGGTPAQRRQAIARAVDDLSRGDAAPALLRRLSDAWAAGDHRTLADYERWCDCVRDASDRAALRRLVGDRNPRLAARIEALHAGGAQVFAAVGSLHLTGPAGVPALLARRGFRVERIRLEEPMIDWAALWDFDDPAASEARFRARLAHAEGDDALSLQTQIARTFSLRRRFAEAHALLDTIAPRLATAGAEPQVRALLERGRSFRSAGEPARAAPLFEQAEALARRHDLQALRIDALHMRALVAEGPEAPIVLTQQAIALARASVESAGRAWLGSLSNNLGMALHDAGRHEEALAAFREALAAREAAGDAARARIARWTVAWALRTLARHDEALALLRPLEAEFAALGRPDGFVFEELGENLLALGRADEAAPWFARAHALLAADTSGERPDDERLARLARLAGLGR